MPPTHFVLRRPKKVKAEVKVEVEVEVKNEVGFKVKGKSGKDIVAQGSGAHIIRGSGLPCGTAEHLFHRVEVKVKAEVAACALRATSAEEG